MHNCMTIILGAFIISQVFVFFIYLFFLNDSKINFLVEKKTSIFAFSLN